MKKILLPTDFSENSWNAIKYALQMFKDTKCVFHLINTYMPRVYYLDHTQVSSPQFRLMDSMKKASVKGLEDIENRIYSEFNNINHSFSKISAINTLNSEIKQLQKDGEVDLIVMGTKGASGAKEVLFGSNTVHVIKNIKCPVLAIPEGFKFEKPLEILFPSDLEIDFKLEHLNTLKEIVSMYHSRINILNVSYGYDLTEYQTQNKQQLKNHFNKNTYLFHSLRNENVVDAIAHFQMKKPINLLMMIKNKHSFFENLFFKPTINQIGYHLNIPFLVIPFKR